MLIYAISIPLNWLISWAIVAALPKGWGLAVAILVAIPMIFAVTLGLGYLMAQFEVVNTVDALMSGFRAAVAGFGVAIWSAIHHHQRKGRVTSLKARIAAAQERRERDNFWRDRG